MFTVLEQPEVFASFEQRLASGERLWWDETSPEWIAGVAGTGRPFYTRLVPGGLGQVPGLAERLAAGCRIVDTACGAGAGVVRLAETYPACHASAWTATPTPSTSRASGLPGRHRQPCHARPPAARGAPPRQPRHPRREQHLDARVPRHRPGGRQREDGAGARRLVRHLRLPVPRQRRGAAQHPWPDSVGHQFFEAQIDDQLLPRAAYDELLARHGFTDVDSVILTPLHALTFGRRPA